MFQIYRQPEMGRSQIRNEVAAMIMEYPQCRYTTFAIEPEEPPKGRGRLCEGRLSSTVPPKYPRGRLWEREGETPSRDPTSANA